MKKKIKGVITYLLRDNFTNSEVLAIRYKNKSDKGYYDIPGAELNNNETIVELATSSFKKDTGIDIYNPSYKGSAVVEYPDKVYEISIYVTRDYEYNQKPKDFPDHKALWIPVEKVVFEEKSYPSIDLLNYLFKDQVNVHMEIDENNKYIKVTEN